VDDLNEAYGGMEKHIHALETGLSSDPEMNWMISKLDKYTLVSNSDSHSPEKMGREANVFELEEPGYKQLIDAIKTRKGFVKTYEFFPDEGKYHYDGHRDCNVLLDPWEAKKLGNMCPVCKRQLTIGVMHRVADLADRKFGEKPAGAVPFKHIVPLPTVIGKALGKTEISKPVREEYGRLIRYFGNEFAIYEADAERIRMATEPEIAEASCWTRRRGGSSRKRRGGRRRRKG
jgi:PHP family Zn ribbon phosphoesterase